MSKTKKIVSMLLAVILIFSVVSVTASAAGTKWGYMIPTDAKFTKQASTVSLYGKYDYINFYVDSNSNNTYFFYEIYSDSKYSKMVAYDYVLCDKGEYTTTAKLDLRELKTATYYGVCYTAKIYSDGSYALDENSLVSFKIKVDRTSTFSKQMLILKSASVTLDGPVIKWSKLSGATKYIVYRRSATGTKWTKLGSTTSTSYTDKSVKAKSGAYVYTVKGVDKNGKGSRYLFAGVGVNFVGAPKVSSVKLSGNDYTVSWNKISGVKTYYVYRKVSGGSWSKVGTITNGATSFTDKTSKTSGTKYVYTVKASRTINGSKVTSKYYSGKSAVFVTAPKISSLSVSSDNRIVVKWAAVKNSTYDVYRKVSGGKWELVEKGFAGTTYYDATAKENLLKYSYAVKATQETSYGKVKGHYLASKYLQFVEMPSEVEIVKEETGVKLIWNAVEGAKSYTIFTKNINGEGSWVKAGVASTTEFIDTESGITGSRLYTVRADGASKGSYSGAGFEYFNPASPELTVTVDENGVYTISWDAVEGADSYDVYKLNGDGEWELFIETSELSIEDVEETEPGTAYSVVAKRGEKCGEFNDVGYSTNATEIEVPAA